jgi:hypothetical protein
MRHAREDYEAIQPFPTKRPHHVRVDGDLVMDSELPLGVYMDPIIPDDEPVFLIRAKDIVGPETVRMWAQFSEDAGADSELVFKVREWAQEMENYAAAHYNGGKVADTPEGILK